MRILCTILLIFIAVSVSAEFDIRGAPCNITGSVVDQNGSPLNGVELEVIVTELVELQPVRSKTNLLVGTSFNLVFPVVAELDIIARKEGYVESTAHLTRRELNADDVLMQLVLAPPATQLVQVEGVDLWLDYEGRGTGVALETGEIVSLSDNPDLFFALHDGWSATNNTPPSVLYLRVREGGGLFSITPTTRKYVRQYIAGCVEAPTDGYQTEIDIPLGGGASPLLFFHTPSGKYGKLQIRVLNAIHRQQKVMARLEYYLQMDGTRNLNNAERLKLIRAKKRVAEHP